MSGGMLVGRRQIATVFPAFVFAYFLSTLAMVMFAIVLIAIPAAGTGAWAVFLCASTVVTLAQPADRPFHPRRLRYRGVVSCSTVRSAGLLRYVLSLLPLGAPA